MQEDSSAPAELDDDLPYLQLTQEQKRIQNRIFEFAGQSDTPYIAVAGYAGTGKTTVVGDTARQLLDMFPGIQVRFLSFTGKASSVLKSKLQDFGIHSELRAPCSTIHSYMYWPKGMDEKSKNLIFEQKDAGEIQGDLLIVDEASMLSTKLFKDLLRLGRPIIFVGDPGQLPPVEDNGKVFTPLVETPLCLTEIHRQAAENPIIQLATQTRQWKPIAPGNYKNKVYKGSIQDPQALGAFRQFMYSVGNEDTVVLCATNKSRVSINRQVREARRFTADHPMAGERLVCLQNTPRHQIMNGQCVHVERTDVIEKDLAYQLVVRPEGESRTFRCIAYAKAFHNLYPNELKLKLGNDADVLCDIVREYDPSAALEVQDMSKAVMLFDYGYALTAHKAQGSEWERVAVFDTQAGPKQSKAQYYQWLYTAITRARDKLLIVSS